MTEEIVSAKKMKQIRRVLKAAIAYAELAERHLAHEEWRTKTLQEAANLARAGKTAEAKSKELEVNLQKTLVFDYTDVSKELVAAIRPWRKK